MRNLLEFCIIARVWTFVKKILITGESSTTFWITIVSWIVLMSLEPLFCYIFVINDEKKSLEFNRKVWVILVPCVLCLYNLLMVPQPVFRRPMWATLTAGGFATMFVSLTWLLSELPLSKGRKDAPMFLTLMILFLTVYLLRVFGLYVWFADLVTRTSSNPAGAAGLKIGLNLVLYFFGGQLFGGLWYLFAVLKRMQCWSEACSNHHGCYYAYLGFHVTMGDNKFLNSICLTNDTKNRELGILEKAFETGIIEMKDLPKKWLYCFRWGLQNLSNFGQSLTVSTDYWENIFVILFALYAMVTFIFFIGNVQMLIISATKKLKEIRQNEERMRQQEEEIRRKQQEMEQWFPFKKLSEELQNSIKECEQYKWQQTECVNIKYLLNNLPIDLQKNVKRDICLQMLKKIEKFQGLSEASLVYMCDYMKPMVYAESTRIVNQGDPIIAMYFVIQGNLWTYSSCGTATSSTNNDPQQSKKDDLTYGDFWGEELVSWAQNELSSSNMPSSNRTIQALTKVEAFVIMALDLKNIFIKHKRAQVIQSYFRRSRMRALRRNAQTSTQAQAPAAEVNGPEIVVVQEK